MDLKCSRRSTINNFGAVFSSIRDRRKQHHQRSSQPNKTDRVFIAHIVLMSLALYMRRDLYLLYFFTSMYDHMFLTLPVDSFAQRVPVFCACSTSLSHIGLFYLMNCSLVSVALHSDDNGNVIYRVPWHSLQRWGQTPVSIHLPLIMSSLSKISTYSTAHLLRLSTILLASITTAQRRSPAPISATARPTLVHVMKHFICERDDASITGYLGRKH